MSGPHGQKKRGSAMRSAEENAEKRSISMVEDAICRGIAKRLR